MTTNETKGEQMDEDLSRNAVTKRMKAALKARSGKSWSVKGGTGSAYGWINITAKSGENLTDEQRRDLAKLMNLSDVHFQGLRIPASNDYYREYIDRAEGREPRKIAAPYWD